MRPPAEAPPHQRWPPAEARCVTLRCAPCAQFTGLLTLDGHEPVLVTRQNVLLRGCQVRDRPSSSGPLHSLPLLRSRCARSGLSLEQLRSTSWVYALVVAAGSQTKANFSWDPDMPYNYKMGPADAILLTADLAVRGSLAGQVQGSLTAIDTRRNWIDGEAAEQLAAAVLGSSSMATFGDVPIKELRADALTTLDLSRKDLGLTEVLVLAGLLPVSHSLTQVLAMRKCWSW